MTFKSLLLHAAFGAAAVAASALDPRIAKSECGTPSPSPEFLETIKLLAGNESLATATASGEKIKITTYIHVIASSNSPTDGYISVSSSFPL